MHVTCLPNTGDDVGLAFDQVADVMSARVNDATALVVLYARIDTCQ